MLFIGGKTEKHNDRGEKEHCSLLRILINTQIRHMHTIKHTILDTIASSYVWMLQVHIHTSIIISYLTYLRQYDLSVYHAPTACLKPIRDYYVHKYPLNIHFDPYNREHAVRRSPLSRRISTTDSDQSRAVIFSSALLWLRLQPGPSHQASSVLYLLPG